MTLKYPGTKVSESYWVRRGTASKWHPGHAHNSTNASRLLMRLSVLLILLLLLVGCGIGDENGGSEEGIADATMEGEPEISSLRLGNLELAATKLPHVADEEGYFEEVGLEIDQTFAEGGAALLSGLEAGEFDIAYSSTTPLLVARSQGFDFQLVLDNGRMPDEPPDSLPLMVHRDAGIEEPSDLEGARVALNNIGSDLHLYFLGYLAEEGVDADSVEIVEAPFPTMEDGLVQGDYDAAGTVEPFRTHMVARDEIEEFDSYYTKVNPGFNIAGWHANEDWLEENPNTAHAFLEAMEMARVHVNEDQEARESYAAEWTGLDHEIVANLRWQDREEQGWRVSPLQITLDLAVEHDFIDESFPVNEAIWDGAPIVE